MAAVVLSLPNSLSSHASSRLRWSSTAGFAIAGSAATGLPAAWFAQGSTDLTLNRLIIRTTGRIFMNFGSADGTAGPHLAAAVRAAMRMVLEIDGDALTIDGIGGSDTTDPYVWDSPDAASIGAFAAAASRTADATLTLEPARRTRLALVSGAPVPAIHAGLAARRTGLAVAAGAPSPAFGAALDGSLGRWRRSLRASAPADTLLTALEIRHPAVAEPVRVVNDTVGRRIEGRDYVALRFDARLADDVAGQAPQAELAIDNVGRALTQWIEAAHGGIGATVRVMLVLAIDDPPVEWEVTLDVAGMNVDQERVTARLGFDPLLGRAAVALRHDPQTSPGLF